MSRASRNCVCEAQAEREDKDGDGDGDGKEGFAVGGEMQTEMISASNRAFEERWLLLEERKLEEQRLQREEQRLQRQLEDRKWQEELELKRSEQKYRETDRRSCAHHLFVEVTVNWRLCGG